MMKDNDEIGLYETKILSIVKIGNLLEINC